MTANYFQQYIPGFFARLAGINAESITQHPVCKKYLEHVLQHGVYYLHMYADVFTKIIHAADKPQEDIELVDYGAGNGLMGIFAVHCGFKKVFINDIDAHFMEAAKNLAKALQIEVNGFIEGDIHAVEAFLKDEKITAIAGTDVIEHIYDLDDLFKTIRAINPAMITCFTTASNPDNYLKSRRLMRVQRQDELKGAIANPGNFDPTGHGSFLSMRQDIIRNEFPAINETVRVQLAELTRGMNHADIILAVNYYLSTGKLPAANTHPTNTCNPYSGSWTERLLSIQEYRDIYHRHGFQLHTADGFYDAFSPGLKGFINKLRNIGVSALGKKISPFISLTGIKK